MNNELTKTSLENFQLDIIETKTSQPFVSFQHDGQHYLGFIKQFLNEKNGKIWARKSAILKICNYLPCKICHPNNTII